MNKTPEPRIAVPIAELAKEISVGHRQIVDWIKAGLLPAFLTPGKDLASTNGLYT